MWDYMSISMLVASKRIKWPELHLVDLTSSHRCLCDRDRMVGLQSGLASCCWLYLWWLSCCVSIRPRIVSHQGGGSLILLHGDSQELNREENCKWFSQTGISTMLASIPVSKARKRWSQIQKCFMTYIPSLKVWETASSLVAHVVCIERSKELRTNRAVNLSCIATQGKCLISHRHVYCFWNQCSLCFYYELWQQVE